LAEDKGMRLRFWLGFAVVAAIAIGSVSVALVVHAREADNFEQLQSGEAKRSARQAEAMAALSIGRLSTAAAFFRVEDDLSRHEYEEIARSLLRSSALSTTALVRGKPDCCRAAQVVSELRAGGRSSRDLDSDPRHGAAIRRARDSGRPAATPLGPVLIAPGQGLLVYQPVYRDGAPTATVAQRRRALLGFAAGSFRADELAAAATAALPDEVDVQLRQGDATLVGPEGTLEDASTAPIRIADRNWLLVVRDPNRPGVSLSLLIAGIGLSLAALLGALVLVWSRSERMQELQRQASHDPLTGLKNRRRFEEDLRTELARSHRDGREGALLMLDLDNFKRVNDTLGHPAGDRVISEIAGVLRGRMRETDVVARLGGDEFAVVLPRCTVAEARNVSEAIATSIREHVGREPGVPPITASVGFAMFGPDAGLSFESVLGEADTAMYAAKESGRDSVRSSAPEPVAQSQHPAG